MRLADLPPPCSAPRCWLPVPASAAPFAGLSNGLPVQTQTLDNSLVQKVRYYRRHHRRHNDAGAVAAGASDRPCHRGHHRRQRGTT